jgi:hypothetical protein
VSCLGDRIARRVSSSNEWWCSPTAASRLASTGEALPTARNWQWPIRVVASPEPARRRGMLGDAVLALLMGSPGEDQKQREEADHVADENGPALAQPLTEGLGLRELARHCDVRRGAEPQHQTAEADRVATKWSINPISAHDGERRQQRPAAARPPGQGRLRSLSVQELGVPQLGESEWLPEL